jgi:hypothetical protein
MIPEEFVPIKKKGYLELKERISKLKICESCAY